MYSQKNINFFSRINSSISKNNHSFQKSGKEKIKSILTRISKNDPSKVSTIKRLINKRNLSSIYKIKKGKESDYNQIKQDMSLQEKKFIHSINDFKKDIFEFNKLKIDNFNNISEVIKENKFFSKNYANLLRKKNKNVKDPFMENEFFFHLANKYLLNKKKLPDMSRNLFNLNPLILDNDHMKQFFINNKVDSSKFLKFLDKLKEMVYRKITGLHMLTPEEKKHLDNIIEQEKAKDYIPPEKEIPILQQDISKSQYTYNCLINEYKSKTIEEPNKNKKINLILPKKNSMYNLKKIKILKNVNLNRNNKINYNISNNINNNSIDTTSIPIDSINNSIKSPRENIINNLNKLDNQPSISILSLRHKLKSNTSKVVNFIYYKENENDNSNPKNYLGRRGNRILTQFYNNKSLNENFKIGKELDISSILTNNKSDLFKSERKIDFTKFMRNNNTIEMEKSGVKFNSNKNLELFPPRILKLNDESNDLSRNIFNNNISKESPEKIKLNTKFDFFKRQMTKIIQKRNKPKKDIPIINSQNIEDLYKKALNLKSNSFEDQYELENYLSSSQGNKSLNSLLTLKNAYYNIHRIEKSFSKNIIKADKKLRDGKEIQSLESSDKTSIIYKKNNIFTKAFLKNANLFRKIICEKDKNTED